MNLVIGGGSGIGQAVAEVLSGSTVVADRAGTAVQCDLTDASSLSSLARSIDELEALVVTAGVSPAMTDARTIFDVDLAGVARVLDAFDHLVRPGVVAVCVASIAGHLGSWPNSTLEALDDPLSYAEVGLTDDPATAYILAKLGVLRLVRRTARSWGARGARIMSVSPGVVDTPMGRLELGNTAGTSTIVDGSALGRPGRAEEIASVIRFLCSDDASYITGTDVLVDGGSVAALS